MLPQAKEYLELPVAGRGRGGVSLELQGYGPVDTGFQTSGLQKNCESIHFGSFKPLHLWRVFIAALGN